jgi:hypothetical protein
MPRNVQRPEYRRSERGPVAYQRLHQRSIGIAIVAQACGGLADITRENRRRRVIERMGEGYIGVDPFQAELS